MSEASTTQTDAGCGPSEHVDVIVVGAGLSGLAVAHALLRTGRSVKVVEKERKLSTTGGNLGLSPNGMRCFEALGPELFAELKSACKPCDGTSAMFTKSGEPMPKQASDLADYNSIASDLGPEGCKGLQLANWSLLRNILTDNLPKGVLQMGVQHKGYQEDDHGVTLLFENRRPLHGQLLLGCDGALSKIRRQALKEEKGTEFATRVCWTGLVGHSVPVVKDGDDGARCHAWMAPPRFGGVVRLPALGGETETAWLACSPAPDGEKLQELLELQERHDDDAQQEKLRLCLESMVDFDQDLLRHIRGSDVSNIAQNINYMRPPGLTWGCGRVALLGDAAHLLPPQWGVGPSLTLEDALAVAHCVKLHGLKPLALKVYWIQRTKRVVPVQCKMCAKCKSNPDCLKQQTMFKGHAMSDEMAKVIKFVYSFVPPPLDADTTTLAALYACNSHSKRPQSDHPGRDPSKRPMAERPDSGPIPAIDSSSLECASLAAI